ncbi:hypothetical protein QBC39DRAFT_119658 [Podospora conica]|nr:hypothetical protein QBC39DRAFT_119658 [Schizothecium conicum]
MVRAPRCDVGRSRCERGAEVQSATFSNTTNNPSMSTLGIANLTDDKRDGITLTCLVGHAAPSSRAPQATSTISAFDCQIPIRPPDASFCTFSSGALAVERSTSESAHPSQPPSPDRVHVQTDLGVSLHDPTCLVGGLGCGSTSTSDAPGSVCLYAPRVRSGVERSEVRDRCYIRTEPRPEYRIPKHQFLLEETHRHYTRA